MFRLKRKKRIRKVSCDFPRNFRSWMKVGNRRDRRISPVLVETIWNICFRCRERGRRVRVPFVKRLAHCRILARVHLTPSATSTIRESRTYVNWPAHHRPPAIDIGRTVSVKFCWPESKGTALPPMDHRFPCSESNCSTLNPRKLAVYD